MNAMIPSVSNREFNPEIQKRWDTLFLAGFLIFVVFLFLGVNLFSTKGEPREAVIAVSMIRSGNWILPVTFGAEIPYKPPMLAWCIALLGWLNGGHVTEFIARLPSAIAFAVMAVATFRVVSSYRGNNMGLAAAVVLAGCFEVYRNSTICRVDMLVTMFIVTSIYAFYRHSCRYPQGTWRPSIAAALLMTGGVMTKGPIGMLLPCMVIFVYRLIRGNRFWPSVVSVGISGLLALVVPFCWYAAAYRLGGDEFLRLALEENVGRFSGTMSYASHENSAWFNFLTVGYGISPYNLLLLMSLLCLPWRRWVDSFTLRNPAVSGIWKRMRSMGAFDLLSLLAIVLIFGFYCIPKSKRSAYLLPIYPFIAYYIAVYVRWLLDRYPALIRGFCWLISAIGALMGAGVLALMFGPAFNAGSEEFNAVLAAIRAQASGFRAPVACIVGLAAAMWLARTLVRSRLRVALGYTLLYIPLMYWVAAGAILPPVMNLKSDLPIAHRLETLLPGDEPIYSYRPDIYNRYYTIDFYTADRLRLFEHDLPAAGEVIVGEDDLADFHRRFGKSYRLFPLTVLGRSGETGQTTVLFRFESAGSDLHTSGLRKKCEKSTKKISTSQTKNFDRML